MTEDEKEKVIALVLAADELLSLYAESNHDRPKIKEMILRNSIFAWAIHDTAKMLGYKNIEELERAQADRAEADEENARMHYGG